MSSFGGLIDGLDLRLFEKIESQTSDQDKRSLLACQHAARELVPQYVYLEIGSHLGGSIQPHLLDDRCRKIYSIDKRPPKLPDDRGPDLFYENNRTAVMLENLAMVSMDGLSKLECFDGEVGDITTGMIGEKPDLCFIDGEHTDRAVRRDFDFCLEVIGTRGGIIFHDAEIIYNALFRILEFLNAEGRAFRA